MSTIVIVNAVYPPEPVVSAQIGRDLALFYAQKHINVTVLCPFPTRPLGTVYPGYEETSCDKIERYEGVAVVRLTSHTSPGYGLFGRLYESFSFGLHVCRYLETHPSDADVVYANTWPLVSQAMIAFHCQRRGIPLVLHIQDLYPESLLAKLKGCWAWIAATPLKALDKWTAHQSTALVVISDSMRRVYVEDRGIPAANLVTIPNWMDESRFNCLPARHVACSRYGISQDVFSLLFLGNIGPVAGVEGLIRAFHVARLPRAQLIIAGDGSAKKSCETLAQYLGADMVRFISDPDVEHVPLIQSLADVCLLPLRKETGNSSIPSKLMAYLFSAKPILATVDADSDTAQCIRSAQCGWVGEPEDELWLAEKMRDIATLSRSTLEELGANGRRYGLAHFSKTRGVEQLAQTMSNAMTHRNYHRSS